MAGVDGYRGGWVVVTIDEAGAVSVHACHTFAEVVELDLAVIAVDIPIGIPDDKARPADTEARRFVGRRASSVFSTPTRAALEAPTFADAVARAREVTGKGISRQAFALRGRILEVDAMAHADKRLIEVHPEVSFREVAGRPLEYSKHTVEGLLERRALLAEAGLEVPAAREVPEADLLDAAAAAWTAGRYRRGEARPLPKGHGERIGAIWR